MTPTNYDYGKIVSDFMSGERNPSSNILHGFLAGAIGGLIATGLKTLAEQYLPTRPPDQDSPPAIIANRSSEALTGEVLSESSKDAAATSMHWLFGTLLGGAYGAAVEIMPVLSEGAGLPFGTAAFAILHEGILPAADVEAPHSEKDPSEEGHELLTHLIYGFTTEVVRSQVRELV